MYASDDGSPLLFYAPCVLAVLAVILGHVALSKAKRGMGGGRALAIVGVITGYISGGTLLAALLFLALVFMSSAM